MTTDAHIEQAAAPPSTSTSSSLKMLALDTRAAMHRIGERISVAAGTDLFTEDDQTN